MARPILSPVAAQRAAEHHADQSVKAARIIGAILTGTWNGDDDAREDEVLRCAKLLEAAGCYIRRQNAKGLLTP